MSCGCVQIQQDDLVPLDNLMRFVAATIPDIPYEVGIEYVRQAYVLFARRSRLLSFGTEVELQRGVREYILHAPEGYEIHGILQPDGEYGRVLYPDVSRWFAYCGERVRLQGTDRLFLETAPSQDGRKLRFMLHLVPASCVDTIPRELENEFGLGIAKGAIGELLEMPAKAWSNPRAAATYKLQFNREVMAAKNLQITNRGARRVMMDRVRVL